LKRYHLVHVTEFHYERPVSESYNEVRLRPMHDDQQSCLSFRLATVPGSRAITYQDAFGNWVHQVNVLASHQHLRVQAESAVLTHATPKQAWPLSLQELDAQREKVYDEFYDFLVPTPYVPLLPQLQGLVHEAEQQSEGNAGQFAQAASDLIHRRFQYVKGATHVHSSIADSLSMGVGVCQDFAHLLLGVVRKRGLPARYVSGYLVPEGNPSAEAKQQEVIGGQASHAWTEVYIPGCDWIPLDPTLGSPVQLRHVRIAYGRDYDDVAPLRGVYKGYAGQRLSVDVSVRPAISEDGHEQLSEPGAGPTQEEVAESQAQQVQQQQ
jgi:transglutaminase-like putative cysteine protease